MNMYLDDISINNIAKTILNNKKTKIVAIRVPFNYDFKKLLQLTERSSIFTFNKPNGKLNYFLVILEN